MENKNPEKPTEEPGTPKSGDSSGSAKEYKYGQSDRAYDPAMSGDSTPPDKDDDKSGYSDYDNNFDQLGTIRYVNGLVDFIRDCATPMTIALQGDWGTGKTSFMNAIREKLGTDMKTIFFRTWEYSRFRNADEMYAAFGVHIVSELEKRDENSAQKKGFLSRVKAAFAESACARFVNWIVKGREKNTPGKEAMRGFLMLLASAGTTFLRLKACPAASLLDAPIDTLESGLNRVTDAFLEREKETVKSISELKENLAALASGHGRVVIFVDDLDRLNPQTAVEFLELLKLFFDVRGCVFVLAVDYDVVASGLQSKFKKLTPEKSRSFFDKIIQLPFQMPVERYNIRKMFESLFRKDPGTDDAPLITGDYTDAVIALFTETLGANPRTMKRLYNAYELNALVCRAQQKELDEYRSALLLVSLIVQLKSIHEYQAILRAESAGDLQTYLGSQPRNKLCKEISDTLDDVAETVKQKGNNADTMETFLWVAKELSPMTYGGNSPLPTQKARKGTIESVHLDCLGDIPFDPPITDGEAMAETFERLLNSYLDTSSDPDKVEKVEGFINEKNQAFVRHELPTGVKSNFKTNVQLSLHGFPYAVYLATKNNTVATTKSNGESNKNGKLDYVARLCQYMRENQMKLQYTAENGETREREIGDDTYIFWERGKERLYCYPTVEVMTPETPATNTTP